MLHFTFGETETFNLSLSELATLETPYYLFVFTRRVPGRVVSFALLPTETTEKLDTFEIDIDTLFDGAEVGQYTYEIYEQNNDFDLTPEGEVIESGIMHLHPETAFSFIERATSTSYISR